MNRLGQESIREEYVFRQTSRALARFREGKIRGISYREMLYRILMETLPVLGYSLSRRERPFKSFSLIPRSSPPHHGAEPIHPSRHLQPQDPFWIFFEDLEAFEPAILDWEPFYPYILIQHVRNMCPSLSRETHS